MSVWFGLLSCRIGLRFPSFSRVRERQCGEGLGASLTLCHFQPLCGDSVNEGRVRQGMAESLSLASCVCPGVGRSGRCICRKMNFIAL